MKKKFGFALLMSWAVAIATMAGCSSNENGTTEKPKAGLQVVDTQMTTAKSNAAYLAGIWQQTSPEYADWGLEPATDSTISTECPQGDGWATLYLIAPKSSPAADRRVALKCSTWSVGKGCMLQSDFNTKPYKRDDGQCQPVGAKVVYPLTKLVSAAVN